LACERLASGPSQTPSPDPVLTVPSLFKRHPYPTTDELSPAESSKDRVVFGVTDEDADEYGPVPESFTAATRKVYAVAFVKPVTFTLRDVDTESEKVVHDTPVQ
jgi:hypothetical protein